MMECGRVMIVDDEYIMRQGIKYMINWEEYGFQVVGEASNGKEALDFMEKLKPNVVFCDIAMPVMDGLDFVRIVHRKYPDVQILILSAYDKFEYVRQALLNGAVDYVLKPTLNPEELLKILSKIADKIPGVSMQKKSFSSQEQQIERFLKGYEQEIKKQDLIQYFPHSCYMLAGVPVHFCNLAGQDLSQIIFEKVEEYLTNSISGEYVKFFQSPEFLCIVFNYPLKNSQKILGEIQNMVKSLKIIHNQTIVILGKQRKNLEEVKKDFSNPIYLETDSFYHRGEEIIFMGEEQEETDRENVFHKFDFRTFSVMLADKRYKDAVAMFEIYINQAMESKMPEFKLKNQTKNLLYNVVGNVGKDVQNLENLRYKYFEEIDKAVYAEDFKEIFQSLVKELLEKFGEHAEGQDEKLQEMLDYIAQHYKEELDLAELSNIFNFNYSYLSTYFNTRMGEGFSEYLNRIRIKQACRYLTESSYSIAAVSDMVGYADQSYFCRVFKKITGETPSSYRHGYRMKKK
jgi:two-component system response regulator YesN